MCSVVIKCIVLNTTQMADWRHCLDLLIVSPVLVYFKGKRTCRTKEYMDIVYSHVLEYKHHNNILQSN